MATKFGYTQSVTSMPVTMAITSSAGSLRNTGTWFRFPQYTASVLNYTVEYYNDGVLLETVPDSVPVSSPDVTSVATTNKPEGSAIVRYEFPTGTTAAAPSATNPYTITAENNVIKVYYKSSVIESPSATQMDDQDYVIISFDANDLNNNLEDEVIRGRLSSKISGSTVTNRETITYAVLKGTKWNYFASVAATPTLSEKNGYWVFDHGSGNYVRSSWKDDRVPVGTTMEIPAYNSEEAVESIFLGSDTLREKTYYAQYTPNPPMGAMIGSGELPFWAVSLGLLLLGIILISGLLKKMGKHEEF